MLGWNMKSLLGAIVLALAITGAPAPSQALDTTQAAGFLNDLQEQAASRLGDTSISDKEKEDLFRKLFNSNFDVPAIGRFVIGRYWRAASPEDQKSFLAVFEDAMVQRFLPLLAENSSERFQIGNVIPDSRNENMALIDSRISRAEGEPYKVSWRVREKNGDFKILDIVAEGVSMAITLRSEYGTVLKNNGGKLPPLTEALREKVSRGAFTLKQ
ncbi:ABC transporter substrate-binding protein [Pelagibius litoralis]|uniref:ABC transporter substrate-binding protein n=1 Tax=Pelagibius litoralis TaxID=374515 RepID=A0A967EVY2_9PROT|nr:ABC transporter substrate-binding protein [Pelagibius litoralis]NIA68674.1 ABC transporter substrate-binding protein [Pelagibius litoralis]